MNRYIVLCDCGQEICRIDDDRLGTGQLDVEPAYVPPGGLVSVTGRAEDANRRGDRRSLHRLWCPVCPKPPTPQPVRDSTLAAVLDVIPDALLKDAVVSSRPLVKEVYEGDRPATREDLLRWAAKIGAMLRGEVYDGESARMIPEYGHRYVIPWGVFLSELSKLSKDR